MHPSKPPIFSYLNTLLTKTTKTNNLNHTTQLHSHLITTNLLPHPLLHTQLINLYALSGRLDRALLTFRNVSHHSTIITYTSLITHLTRSRNSLLALTLFSQLRAAGLRPNPFTFSALLPACSASITSSPSPGPQIHSLSITHGVDTDVFVASALANMYAKSADMASARKLFDEMPNRNLVSWNALIVGYLTNNLYRDAIRTFQDLLITEHSATLTPNQVTVSSVLSACANSGELVFGRRVHARAVKLGLTSLAYVRNSMIDMYSKCGNFDEAAKLFDSAGGDRDVVAWNIMMMGFVQSDRHTEAVKCFWDMRREGILPDESSFSTALQASASLAMWSQGAAVHAQVVKAGFASNACVGSALVTAYAKCGTLDDAHRAFWETRDQLNVVSWTAMIAAFQQHGHGDRVFQLFEQMLEEGIEPDYITFVCVLSACSHNGLIEQGFRYFNSMSRVHNMAPGNEHYACVVDMLGRAGRLDEAKHFIDTMPFEPDKSVWGALLGACRNCGNLELGEEVARRLFEMEPDNPGNYVLLSNIYASRGRLEEAKEVRRLMGSNRVRKETGCSWIDVENMTHAFKVHDRSHDRTEEIYDMLGKLEELTKDKRHDTDTRFTVNVVGDYMEAAY